VLKLILLIVLVVAVHAHFAVLDLEVSRAADAWAIKWHNFMRSIEMQIRRESKKENTLAPTAATTTSSPVYLHEALYSYRRFG